MSVDFPAYEMGAIPPLGPDTPVELIDPRLLDYGQCCARRATTSTR